MPLLDTYETAGIVAGPDGALWTVDDHAGVNPVGYVARVSTAGVLTTFSPPDLPQLTGVATSIGLVYFGVSASSPYQIGTIDGNGNVTMLANPTAFDFKPRATGPDGSIWGVADGPGPEEPAKLVGSSPVPDDVGYEPQDVAAGADGNTWFTATETDDGINHPVVGKISTSGTGLATYPVPAG